MGKMIDTMNRQQQTLMIVDPGYGTDRPYPSQAAQWREYNGCDGKCAVAWLYNPWTKNIRNPMDVASDPFGHLIVPPGESIVAS
jgi:hypothetical protein